MTDDSESFFEDAEPGVPSRSRGYTVSEAEVIRFASEWNPEPYHIDPEAARANPIGRIFAAGPHLIAICTRLANERRPRPVTVAGMGWDELRFLQPVFPGDTLCAEITPLSKRLSQSRPGFGIVVYGMRLLNQRDEAVLTYRVTALLECRAHRESAAQ